MRQHTDTFFQKVHRALKLVRQIRTKLDIRSKYLPCSLCLGPGSSGHSKCKNVLYDTGSRKGAVLPRRSYAHFKKSVMFLILLTTQNHFQMSHNVDWKSCADILKRDHTEEHRTPSVHISHLPPIFPFLTPTSTLSIIPFFL